MNDDRISRFHILGGYVLEKNHKTGECRMLLDDEYTGLRFPDIYAAERYVYAKMQKCITCFRSAIRRDYLCVLCKKLYSRGEDGQRRIKFFETP